eukprot:TRINITY_DN6713_c0_g4_i2.p1 TRINITY_DN6713_c0_g4~~TRINITY_DN6713_c0_g4_i2.p1  ORF type:complete len:303 (+),score=-15.71 TRINITY_DN6713_c0_g4_i2:1152-2060(+)
MISFSRVFLHAFFLYMTIIRQYIRMIQVVIVFWVLGVSKENYGEFKSKQVKQRLFIQNTVYIQDIMLFQRRIKIQIIDLVCMARLLEYICKMLNLDVQWLKKFEQILKFQTGLFWYIFVYQILLVSFPHFQCLTNRELGKCRVLDFFRFQTQKSVESKNSIIHICYMVLIFMVHGNSPKAGINATSIGIEFKIGCRSVGLLLFYQQSLKSLEKSFKYEIVRRSVDTNCANFPVSGSNTNRIYTSIVVTTTILVVVINTDEVVSNYRRQYKYLVLQHTLQQTPKNLLIRKVAFLELMQILVQF